MQIRYNKEKNEWLRENRKVTFQDVIIRIEEDKILDIIPNPSARYSNQKCFVLNIRGYIYLVPFVKENQGMFLKTMYPSRKFTKKYL